MNCKGFSLTLITLLVLLLGVAMTLARSGRGYELTWWTVDGGGIIAVGTGSPNPYSLDGTVGQPDAGHAFFV